MTLGRSRFMTGGRYPQYYPRRVPRRYPLQRGNRYGAKSWQPWFAKGYRYGQQPRMWSRSAPGPSGLASYLPTGEQLRKAADYAQNAGRLYGTGKYLWKEFGPALAAGASAVGSSLAATAPYW